MQFQERKQATMKIITKERLTQWAVFAAGMTVTSTILFVSSPDSPMNNDAPPEVVASAPTTEPVVSQPSITAQAPSSVVPVAKTVTPQPVTTTVTRATNVAPATPTP